MISWDLPYSSIRQPILAANVVATSQPLAAQAGLRILQEGGNAVDAAIATAIALTVVEPTMNGIGSDAFCIIWDGERLHGLNASGRSPANWTRERFADSKQMPTTGWDSVTVPGCVSGWVALSERFGRLPFTRLFEPAIRYAEFGYLVGPVTASVWEQSAKTLGQFPEFARTFLPDGRAPKTGELFTCPAQSNTLQLIAESNGSSFYNGALAEQIVANSSLNGGLLSIEDLTSHQCDWVGTVSQDFLDYSLHEIPPNGQGLGALIALGILRCLPIEEWHVDSAESIHVQIEAMKLALADSYRYIADPNHMDVSVDDLLAEDYLRQRASLIDVNVACDVNFGVPKSSGTVYLATADEAGNMVSFIQSNYNGFGSGIVIPDTGISMQNRGSGFCLDGGHPNEVAGGKRPFHTIIPAFLMRGKSPQMSFGVMGGPMQAQGHVQMVVRMCVHGQNPQAAIDGPRWQIMPDQQIAIESHISGAVLDDLEKRGHKLHRLPRQALFGGAQLIYRLNNGYCGASEPRKEGQAIGF